VTHGSEYLGRCWGAREECPRALALQRALREALGARGPQQAATGITAAACELVGGPRQARHVRAVQQAGPRAPADRVAVTATRRADRRDIGPPHHRVESAAQVSRHLRSTHRVGGRGFSEGSDVAEPGGTLLDRLGGLRKGG